VSELARGIVLIGENVETLDEGVSKRAPVTLQRAAGLAIDVMSDEALAPEEDDVSAAQPDAFREPRRRILKPDQKVITLDVRLGHERINRPINVRSFGELDLTTKLLLAASQANAPQYSFFETDDQRQGFIRTMVNKGVGEKARLSTRKVGTMLRKAVKRGFLDKGEEPGWELTDRGMEHLLGDEKLKKKLKNPAPIM